MLLCVWVGEKKKEERERKMCELTAWTNAEVIVQLPPYTANLKPRDPLLWEKEIRELSSPGYFLLSWNNFSCIVLDVLK